MNQITLPKRVISLTKRRYFLLLKEQGKKFSRPVLVLQMMSREESPYCVGLEDAARVGFTVTKQQGNSVIRNRIKRRLRAAAGALLPKYGQAGFDYVLIGRASTARANFDAILKDLQFALDRLHAGKTFSSTGIRQP
jgi:ribonuclease P protein component